MNIPILHIPKFIKKLSKSSVIIAITAAIILLSIVTYTVSAWLWHFQNKGHTLVASNVDVTPVITFVQYDKSVVSGEAYKDSSNYYIVDLDNPSADNYYTKMRIHIQYKGVTMSYIRVHVADMGCVTVLEDSSEINKVLLKENALFKVNPAHWADNRTYDDYYYYINNIGHGPGIYRAEKENVVNELEFITGITDMTDFTNGSLHLYVSAEAVQFNRINVFWNMDNLNTIIGTP